MCGLCGEFISGRIEVHHIRRWADVPALRYDIRNGICLHKKCHTQVTGNEAYYTQIFTSRVQSNDKSSVDSAVDLILLKYGKITPKDILKNILEKKDEPEC